MCVGMNIRAKGLNDIKISAGTVVVFEELKGYVPWYWSIVAYFATLVYLYGVCGLMLEYSIVDAVHTYGIFDPDISGTLRTKILLC